MLNKFKYYLPVVLTIFLFVYFLHIPLQVLAYESQFSGRATDSAGSPIEGVRVIFSMAMKNGTITQQIVQYTLTDLNGNYFGKVEGKKGASYIVKIGFYHEDYFATWNSGASDELSATPIKISESSPTHLINAVLESGGGKISALRRREWVMV